MSVNVLPDMDEPRLKALGKQLNRSRKNSLINTGKMKDTLDVYVKSLNKEKRSLDGKYHVRNVRLKKNLANVRGTQKVLKAKREQTFFEDSEAYPYGIYEGESLDSYRRQVDSIIEQRHPKYRRARKVEQHLKNGLTTGRILDNNEAKTQFDEIMEHGRRTRYLKRENPLTQTFFNYNFPRQPTTMDHLWKDPSIKNKLRMKPTYISEETIVNDAFVPSGIKLHATKGSTGMHRLYSPKTVPLTDDTERDTPGDLKPMRRISMLRKSPISLDSPYTDYSTDAEDDVKDCMTVRSSPSKLNLPPITASKNSIKQSNGKERNKFLPDLSIRRVTKSDLQTNLSIENLHKFERMKTRRATTLL